MCTIPFVTTTAHTYTHIHIHIHILHIILHIELDAQIANECVTCIQMRPVCMYLCVWSMKHVKMKKKHTEINRAITRNTIIFWSIANSSASPKFYYHYDGPAQKLCTEFITLIWFLVQFIIGQTKHLDRNMMVLINIEGVSFTVRFCVIVTV